MVDSPDIAALDDAALLRRWHDHVWDETPENDAVGTALADELERRGLDF